MTSHADKALRRTYVISTYCYVPRVEDMTTQFVSYLNPVLSRPDALGECLDLGDEALNT